MMCLRLRGRGRPAISGWLIAGLLITSTCFGLSAPAGAANPKDADTAGEAEELERVDPSLPDTGTVSVIVRAAPGRAALAEALTAGLGGHVDADVPIIDGYEATIPAAAADLLALTGSVELIAANRDISAAPAPVPVADVPAETLASPVVETSGAAGLRERGLTGAGVAVALVDTGVTPVPALAGRVVAGPDLSGEGDGIDRWGHGTAMAGVIAGHFGGPGGIAPGATIVSVKVAGADGSTTLARMLRAMSWVSQQGPQLGVRVLNLSWGVAPTMAPGVDPLNVAVDELWQRGITTVVSAGNDGPEEATVNTPGNTPSVLTVGALDDRQNVDASDDTVPEWSSRGTPSGPFAKPDVVAPGTYVVSTSSPGSAIEREHPAAVVAPGFIRGSGTSHAAAVTSGATALLLEARPELQPDEVKGLLMSTALPVDGVAPTAQGRGRIDAAAALAAGSVPGGVKAALEVLPGSRLCDTPECRSEASGWDGSRWGSDNWDGSRWGGSRWGGSRWGGSRWGGSRWGGSRWG